MNDKNLYKNIPSNPGVYFFKDKANQIIYIGLTNDNLSCQCRFVESIKYVYEHIPCVDID